jgi:hypothetical protein
MFHHNARAARSLAFSILPELLVMATIANITESTVSFFSRISLCVAKTKSL